MKKQLLTKTLLMAVMLLGGANFAWGTDVTVNTTDNFNYSNGTCLNEAYTDGGSTSKDAIGILVVSEGGDRSGTLSFGTTTTADKILLTANFLISTGNSNQSKFKVVDQAGNEIFAFSIGGSSTVTLTDNSGQSTTASGITTERTKVSTFGGNDYYKTRWTAVTAYLDFTKHYGVVSVGSGKYEIQMSSTSTGVKGFVLTGGKSYGASLVAKDYATTEVTGRYEAGMDVLSANVGGTDYKADYTDYSSVTKNAVGIYAKPNVTANRYGTLTLGATTSEKYINVTGNFVLESGNNDGSTTYLKAIDQNSDEIFAIRMTGNNTTSVKLTDSDNTDGTEVMTVTKRKDSTIGNGSSTYGLTAWTYFNAELNFADHTGSVTIGSTTYSISLKSTSTGIKGFALQAGRGYGAALLSSDYSVNIAAGPVTVKYVDGESNEIAAATTLSVAGKLPDETLGFHSPKFITYEGDLYIIGADASATNPTTNQSVKLTSSAQDKYITYTKKAEGTYYFYEFDGGYTTRANNESNGSAQTKSASVTVPATGVYVVTANCYGSNSGRYADMKVGETTIVESTEIGIYAPGTNLVSNNVLLEKDDVITITTTNSKDGIDYVVLQKIYDVEGEVVGAVDCSTGWTGAKNTTPICINAGETAHFKFVNHNTGSGDIWNNWYLLAKSTADPNAENVLDVRADNFTDGGVEQTSWFSDFNYVSDYNGATVSIDITLTDAGNGTYTFTSSTTAVKADGTPVTGTKVDTQSGLTQSTLYLYMSVFNSWLELIQEAVKKDITSAGYATYYSNNALDFANATPSLTASLITGTVGATTTLALDDVDDVPAETGVLLAGDEATYTIPVIATSSTVTTSNKLEGVHVATEINAATGYVLMGSPKVGFYMNNNVFTVGANTAYLPADFAGARMAFFGFDETTGISLTENSELRTENAVYDLQGRRVAQPQKGLYIVNGKKVVIK